jgi:hypothetical protein
MLVSFLTQKWTIYIVSTRVCAYFFEIIFDYLLLCSYNAHFKFLYGSPSFNNILCSEMKINLFSVAQQPKTGLGGLTFDVLDYTHTHTHTYDRTFLNEWSARRNNAQQRHETNIHALSGFETRNSSSRLAADLRRRPHDHLMSDYVNLLVSSSSEAYWCQE